MRRYLLNLIPKNISGGFWKQLWYTNVAFLTYFFFGLARGYPAFLLHQLESPDSIIKVNTSTEISCIASLSIFPNPVGSVIAGFLMDKWGRKLTLQLSILMFTLGWSVIACSCTLIVLYVGNIIVGLAVGMSACSITYVAEICRADTRCMLLAFMEIHYSLGIVVAFVSTCSLEWKTVAWIFAVLSVFTFMLFCLLRETPYWLVRQDRIAEALDTFVCFRDEAKESKNDDEFQIIVKEHDEEYRQEKGSVQVLRNNLKAFVILISLHMLLQGVGYNIFLSYLTKLLQMLEIPSDYVESTAIGYSVASFIFSFITPLAMDSFPRRKVIILTGIGMAVCLGCIAVYGTFKHLPYVKSNYWLIVPSGLYVYLLCCTLGVLTMSQTMIGELYQSEVRGRMCGFTEAMGSLLCGVSVSIFPIVADYCSVSTTFYCLTAVAALTAWFGYSVLPETFGKSLIEIQDEYFKRKKAIDPDLRAAPTDDICK